MSCRYCGAEIPLDEIRCAKCQRRIPLDHRMASLEPPLVVSTATAPALSRRYEPESSAPPFSTGESRPRATSNQPSLFAYKDSPKVISLKPYLVDDSPPPKTKTADPAWAVERRPPSRKRAAHPGQTSFDFSASGGPTKPFSREMDRRKDFPVASLRSRALGASIDLGVMSLCAALFLLAVRFCLGPLPTSPAFLVSYGVGAILISIIYKSLWCIAREPTLGLRFAGLVTVSFDGRRPTMGQMFARLFSGYLGVASVGMGVVWALADQEHLSWHDHISQTFLTPRGEDGQEK